MRVFPQPRRCRVSLIAASRRILRSRATLVRPLLFPVSHDDLRSSGPMCSHTWTEGGPVCDKALSVGNRHRLSLPADTKLREDVLNVRLDCSRAYDKYACDLVLVESCRKQT